MNLIGDFKGSGALDYGEFGAVRGIATDDASVADFDVLNHCCREDAKGGGEGGGSIDSKTPNSLIWNPAPRDRHSHSYISMAVVCDRGRCIG